MDHRDIFNKLIKKRFEEESENLAKATPEETIPEDYYILKKLVEFKMGQSGTGTNYSYVVSDSIVWLDPATDEVFGPFPYKWKDIGEVFGGARAGKDLEIVPKIRVVESKEEPKKIKIKDIVTAYRKTNIEKEALDEPEDLEYYMHYSGSGISFASSILSTYILVDYEGKDLYIYLGHEAQWSLSVIFETHKDLILGQEFVYPFNPAKIVKTVDGFVFEDKKSSTSIIDIIKKVIPQKAPDVIKPKPKVARRKSK